ncbi:MAG: hypothetical protein EA401_08220 [Planctomycetota bacterium]|nr:MAG: hypothetical protein EA401_08220 [Planctomycetota bacterium]
MRHLLLIPLLLIIAAAQLRAADDAQPPLHIIAFGDSITGNRPGEAYHQHYMKWIDLLGLMLEAHSGRSVQVSNAGYAGDATAKRGDRPGAINRFQEEVIDRQPDLVVVLIGGNDAGGRVPTEETAANLRSMLGAMKEAELQVITLQYAGLFADGEEGTTGWTHLVDNNELIAEISAELEIPSVALQPHFDAAAEHYGSHRPLVNHQDRVHLAPGGEIVTARATFQALRELGWFAAAE